MNCAVRRLARACLLLTALVTVSACSGAPKAASEALPAPSTSVAATAHPEADLATARDKLALAKLQLELAGQRSESAKVRKEKELELARAELLQFDEADAPSRLAKSKLELSRRRDTLAEQKEELQQLEMLYEKEDLADKTREIVLQRGKRRVARAEEDLAIAERDTAALEAKTLPRERGKLQLELDAKMRALAEGERDAQVTDLEKRMAVRTAETELKTAEEKAAKAEHRP